MLDEDTRDITKYIICGRGKSNYNCEGNIVFRQSIAKHVISYINFETRAKKSRLILRVAEELRNLGMIFMVISDDGTTLKELSPTEARKKVAHRFRDVARVTKQFKAKAQMTKSVRTKKPTFNHLGKKHKNLSLSINSPCLPFKERAKRKQTLLPAVSLKEDKTHQFTHSTVSKTKNVNSCTGDDSLTVRSPEEMCQSQRVTHDHAQELVFLSTHTESVFYDSKILPSLSSHQYSESMSLQYEIVKKQQTIFSDLVELINASPNIDYGEDFDDLSMLLSSCGGLFSMKL